MSHRYSAATMTADYNLLYCFLQQAKLNLHTIFVRPERHCERERERERCVCVRERERAVCVCVKEREREQCVCVCVCVCVWRETVQCVSCGILRLWTNPALDYFLVCTVVKALSTLNCNFLYEM